VVRKKAPCITEYSGAKWTISFFHAEATTPLPMKDWYNQAYGWRGSL